MLGWRTGGVRPLRSGSPAIQAPAHLAAPAPRHVEKDHPDFCLVSGIDGPSRPRRCPRPSAAPGTGLDANNGSVRKRSFSWLTMARRRRRRASKRWRRRRCARVHHEKERRHRGPKFASSPVTRQAASRGHRRGLDGPSMPIHFQINPCLLSTHRGAGAAGWAGAWIAGEPDRSGRTPPVRQPRPLNAASRRARGGSRSDRARGRPAVQAGLQVPVSRRAKSQPTLSQAKQRTARSGLPRPKRNRRLAQRRYSYSVPIAIGGRCATSWPFRGKSAKR